MTRWIPALVLATAAITLLGLNAGAILTVALLALVIGAGLARMFNRQWPKNVVRNGALLVLGPIVLIAVVRASFESIRVLDARAGALLVLVVLVLILWSRNRLRRWSRWQ